MAHLECNNLLATRHDALYPSAVHPADAGGGSRDCQEAPSRGIKILTVLGIKIALAIITCLTPILAPAHPYTDQHLQNGYQRIPGHIVPVLGARQPIAPAP